MSSSGLEDALARSRKVLSDRVLQNEAQVRAAVIAPLLQALGWDPADPTQWLVEYPVDNGRVDDALFGSGGSALVFVEAKNQGNLSVRAENQLFRYAANKGVPILVLTDGDTWDLYLSMAAGEPTERRFAHHTLTESSDLGRVADDLRAFVGRTAVTAGDAHDAASARLKQIKDRKIGKGGLASAWAALLAEPDEMLRDMLIEKVEEDVGARPEPRDAEDFLRRQAGRDAATSGMHSSASRPMSSAALPDRVPAGPTAVQSAAVATGRIVGLVVRGNEHRTGNGQAAMALLAGELQQQNSDFMERFRNEAVPSARRRRPAVRDDSLDDWLMRQVQAGRYRQVDGFPEWWIHVDLKTDQQTSRLRAMAEIAGLPWDANEGVRLIRRGSG